MDAIFGLYRLDGRTVTNDDVCAMARCSVADDRETRIHITPGPLGVGGRLPPKSTGEAAKRRHLAVDGELVVVADVRLDNSEELAERLDLTSTETSVSPIRILAEAYRVWGTGCPEHFEGAFAFAVWDPSRQLLFCARDHLGIRPLYFHHSPGRLFAFASVNEGLLTVPEVSRSPNLDRVADYLSCEIDNNAYSFYSAVRRLPPGHHALVGPDWFRVQRYWTLEVPESIENQSDRGYANGFRRRFSEAVRSRAQDNPAVGVFLSGGLDSSSVVAALQDLRERRAVFPEVHAFSAVFDQYRSCDERRYIEDVLEGGVAASTQVICDDIHPLDDLEEFVRVHNRPLEGHVLNLGYRLARVARSCSPWVVLHGHGGDETLGRALRFWDRLAESGQYGSLLRQAWNEHGFVEGARLAAACWLAYGGRWGPRARTVARRIAPASTRSDGGANSVDGAEWLDRDFWQATRRDAVDGGGTRSRSSDVHLDLLSDPRQTAALEEYARTGDHHGIRFRFPFWDRRLVRYCLGLPADQIRKPGVPRYVLRQALASSLPESVYRRLEKTDFSSLLEGVLDGEQLREMVRGVEASLRGIVDLETLRKDVQMVASTTKAARSAVSMRRLDRVVRALMVGIWLDD